MPPESLGQRIKRMREAKGMTQRQVAAAIGVSQPYLAQVERDARSQPTEKTLSAIADLLDDDLQALMQLAGRIPADVEELLMRDPDMAEALRIASSKGMTGSQLLKWLEKKKGT